MTLDNCGKNTNSGVSNCMYIAGSGLKASEIRGWSTGFGTIVGANHGNPVPVHEQVVAPDGGTICNSPTVSVTGNSSIVSCQVEPNPNVPIAAGAYCSIVWSPDGLDGAYIKLAENCGNAPV